MSYSQLSMPSLAAATGTRLDSACKHIQQCRVSQDHMTMLVNNDADELIRNKYRYCVHKDELVLGIGKSWSTKDKKYNNNAYPRVLSNLGKLHEKESDGTDSEAVKMLSYMYHNATSIDVRDDLLKVFADGNVARFVGTDYFKEDPHTRKLAATVSVGKLHDFVSVGYANTLGWAHAHNGDTMTSVMIGGLRTVMNGDFEIYCGDMIQWYFPFERDCFHQSGKRKMVQEKNATDQYPNTNPAVGEPVGLKDDTSKRKSFYERQYGQVKGVEKCVPLIKAYKRDDDAPRIYDWYRVFAVAISSARAHEMVDIRISRQSL